LNKPIIRIITVTTPICWYVTARTIIFYYFLSGGRTDVNGQFFDWWWSWFMAIPVTAISLVFTAALVLAVIWVVEGFSKP
jgi:hypothetical protein